MLMRSADRWHCTNTECGCEVLVETSGEIPGGNPRCTCGAVMKKKYTSPVLSCLEFLRVDEVHARRGGFHEE